MTIQARSQIVVSSPPTRVEGICRVYRTSLHLQTTAAPEFIDLTPAVGKAVVESGVVAGQLAVFSLHTTAAVVLNEDEPLLHEDVKQFLERMASTRGAYQHDDLPRRRGYVEPDHGRNGHAHLQQMVLGSSLTVPVVGGRLAVGAWQRIFFLELDRGRPREVQVQVMGIAPEPPSGIPLEQGTL